MAQSHSQPQVPPRHANYHRRPVVSLSKARAARRNWRLARAAKYSCFAAAAAVSIPFPSLTVAHAFHGPWSSFSYVWSVVLLIGSLSSLAGILKRSWIGEYIGLWGVFIPLIAYSVSCFLVAPSGPRVVFGLLALGFACSAIARRQDVAQQKRLAEYIQRNRAGRPGL